jgi:hypothetical protein
MHSYKSGNKDAKDMTELEAAAYADEHNIGADNSAEAQLAGEAATVLHDEDDEDAEGEPEKEPTPPPKTPKAKASRKGKATPASAAPEPIVPQNASIIPPKAAPAEKEKSPDKKRKRASKKGADEPVGTIEKEELQVETPKSGPKPRKKKAKADS